VRFQNGSNKVAIELRVVQFWSEIILVISNRTRAARSSDFEITRMISDQIALHSVQLPLLMLMVNLLSLPKLILGMNCYIFERVDNNTILPKQFLQGAKIGKNKNKPKQATQKKCME